MSIFMTLLILWTVFTLAVTIAVSFFSDKEVEGKSDRVQVRLEWIGNIVYAWGYENDNEFYGQGKDMAELEHNMILNRPNTLFEIRSYQQR